MSRLRPALLVALVALVAACGGSVPPGGGTADPEASAAVTEVPAGSSEAPTGPAGSEPPPASQEPAQSGEPAASEEPAASGTPDETEDPLTSDQPTGALTGAEACSGSADNRDFFLDFADRVEWPVLCAVLPRGWFVSQGSYRLANGGKLLVSYRGPDGATIALSQGAHCTAGDGCVPHGPSLGAAPLGPLAGTLYETGDGFGVIAAAGENPSWLMTTEGLDQATTGDLAAALAEVER